MISIILTIISIILTIISILVTVAFFTLCERKVLGALQRRKGPNMIGFWGILQPIADGIKTFLKQILIPKKSNKNLFIIAPILSLILTLSLWNIIPFEFNNQLINIDFSLFVMFSISSLNIYAIILAGWSSNSKYALLGSIRSSAQMISYEISLGLSLIPLVLLSGSLNFIDIMVIQTKTSYVFPLLPITLIFFISGLAETNRTPFDLPEAEAELVAGYNVEYSGFTFAMFYLAEYSNMLIIATIMSILFF